MAKRARLDQVLVARGLCPTREQAQRAIMAGEVAVGTRIAAKASELILPEAEVTVAAPPKYVGRGGLKLEGALDYFNIEPKNRIALDVGASTGGFTDCLLQRGAARIYAIDVGHDQLAWKIRSDPRVVAIERLNARALSREQVPEPIALAVIDVSFISLTLILPKVFDLLSTDGVILALIKPQFELQQKEVGRGGVVREVQLHEKATRKIADFVSGLGHEVIGIVASSVTGAEGNQEFFACLRKQSA